MRYRLKIVEVEAVQLRWENWAQVCDLCDIPRGARAFSLDKDSKPVPPGAAPGPKLGLMIRDLFGCEQLAGDGDYILKCGGGFNVVSREKFELTYELVEGQ